MIQRIVHRILPVLTLAAGLTACGGPGGQQQPAAITPPDAVWSDAGLADLDTYEETARQLLAAIDAGEDSASLIVSGEALMDQGMALMPEFTTRHPHCEQYLRAAARVRSLWRELDHEAIERDYHDDAALPRPDDAGACYHMKDLVVHPATALVQLTQAQADHAGARREIEEVLAHMTVVRRN
jgi:hypothetical protein